MEQLPAIIAQVPVYITAVIAALTGIITLCLLIPGAEPEATLQKVVDFLSKFSKK